MCPMTGDYKAPPTAMDSDNGVEDRLVARLSAGSSPVALPQFARRAIAVGRAAYELQAEGVRAFVTIVIPNRDYFACFVAVGAVDAALNRASPSKTMLEAGTVVRFMLGDKYVTGTYLGQEERTVLGERRTYDSVRVGATEIVLVPSATASFVPAAKKASRPSRGFALHALPDWLAFPKAVFGPRLESTLLSHTELVSTVIGTKSALERELHDAEFTTTQHPRERWSLDRLVLPRAVAPVNQLVEVIAASGSPARLSLARTVILDGVNAIVRWGGSPGPGAHVALVEPTSPALPDAAMALAAVLRFAKRGDDWCGRFSAALDGLEWSAHEL